MSRKDKIEIWKIEDDRECCNIKTGKAIPFYTFNGIDYGGSTVLRKDAGDATLEDLVELCDHDAESVNAHDYCGAHRLLGAVLFGSLGRDQATATMLDIANRRGLHGMVGMCGIPDSYKSLKVGESGRDWSGKFR